MIFLADEGVDKSLVELLRAASYDVFYVAESASSISDEEVLALANSDGRILITRDKDFGELVYRLKRIHSGIILVRMEELPSISRSTYVDHFIRENLDKLAGHFVVLQPGLTRIRKL
ncbi:DUF5615 family PIN-like protein [Haliscomenobacter sp.]|uniref:DUF5615 family PIN-like protein n=1 Tax=Haliscomenobacter sp. TaxID=2717303 RepID=UPI0035936C6D